MTYFPDDYVRSHALDVGGGWSITGLLLARGDTAWNPASTKGPLYGPSLLEYRLHHSGIDIMEHDVGHACFGGEPMEEWPYWKSCTSQPEPGMTRCVKHSLAHYAVSA